MGNETLFWTHVNKAGPIPEYRPDLGPCWLWTAAVGSKGYGIYNDSQTDLAHRLSYRYRKGPIPKGLQIDHLCRVKLCVNPDHLEAVTPRENLMRGNTRAAANVLKTHCPKGHPYDKQNTKMDSGSRLCRRCCIARTKRWKLATGYSITEYRRKKRGRS